MLKRRLLSLILAVAMIGTMFTGLTVFAATDGEAQAAAATTLTVDPTKPEAGNNFQTIRAAVAKAKELKPSETNPVTINVNPGRYEEQVEISGMSYVTLQQTPQTSGYVELSWYYCTGYAAANCDLSGKYNPNIDWYAHPPKDDKGKEYKLGEAVPANTKLTYTTVDGKSVTETVSRATELGTTGGMDKMAALLVQKDASNITVKDLHIINSVPVMVTQGQKDAHLTPLSSFPNLPARDVAALTVSADGETTTEAVPEVFKGKTMTKDLFDQEVKKGTVFSSGESTWLARSGAFNERGHAVACCGDKITFDNIYLRGGQDSLYIAGENRMYFKNSTIIGGTDYIYGSATAVFDTCKLGLEGFSDKKYGSPIATASTPKTTPYGYLFYNCTLYNVRDNNGSNNYGGSWNSDGQVTYYNCKLDDNKKVGKSNFQIDANGWGRFDAQLGLHRLYEYGTTNNSGAAVDLSNRVVNKSVEEGGPGMGTVLDEWQILEFNPRNYFAKKNGGWADDWDPMGVSSKYTNVDAAINAVEFNIPSNESTEIDLPTPPANVEYKWESSSPNAVVKDNKLIVTRPAAGEPNINSEITLYVRDKSDNAIGDKTTVPIEITPTTNTTDVFNIPVKITSSLTLREDNDFTITISKNGAPIKTQVVTMKAGQTEATATIEKVPASADGIDYDVKIVSKSDELTVVSPDNGETTIKGKTGQPVQLNISAQMLIDDMVELGNSVNYSSSGGAKTVYNLIDLAKSAGADESVATSDQITVEYDLTVPAELKQASSYIDLIATTPAQNITTQAVNSRFAFWRLYKGWNQIDMADCNTGFGGTSNTDDQWLNIAGKFDYKTVSHITTTIDYKNQVVSAAATGSGGSQSVKAFTFKSFPSNCERGKLFFAMYPAGSDVWSISNVKVTYKKLVTGELPETPDGKGVYPFNDVDGGNVCHDDQSFKFVGGVDENVAALFASKDDKTIMDSAFTENYKNYVGGTGSNATHPTITLNAPAGKYRIYYVGYNHGNNIQAIVNGKTYTAGEGKQLAARSADSNYVLKYYEIDIEMMSDNSTITFDSTEQWLPDTYCVAVVGSSELPDEPVATESPATEAPATQAPATESPATEPPATPTTAPTTAPTSGPAGPAIVKAYLDHKGNTVAVLSNIDSGVAVAAKYDGGALVAEKHEDIKGNTVIFSGIEADKIMVWKSLDSVEPVCEAKDVSPVAPDINGADINFAELGFVPVYDEESGFGFVSKSDAIMPEAYRRQVADTSKITIGENGASVTESDGEYLYNKASDDYNNGGLIYRYDTGAPGAYHLEVEVADSTNTWVAPTGMEAGRLTGTSTWDNCGNVPRTVSASWSGNVWSYDFATGEDFVEIEIEPNKQPTKDAPQTVGVKSIKITPLGVNPAGDKPTIHILGDSTQKTYSFNETISSWGQTLYQYFDTSKVNVINYSMGGRAMKSNYNEGRTDEPLIRGKKGDYVFIHSAHNDETVSTGRFVRGASVGNNLDENNANYDRWLDMYVKAIKARGMIPVLVTAMPRTGSGKYSESSAKPNGFNPDSPGRMRAKAASDPEVGLVELYAGAKAYIDKLDANEVYYIYNTYEAGETPADGAANGNSGDGTHYREAAARQWCRIMLQSIYDQSVAGTDTYTDKNIMADLVSYMPVTVQNAAKSGDWSAVFPEMASDVSAVDVVPGAEKQAQDNYYYRPNIEKALQIGALHKDSDNNFKPTQTITVGEFARGIETVFGLPANTLNNYVLTYDELMEENAQPIEAASIDDNVQAAAGDLTVTVDKPEGGSIMLYNESQRVAKTADVPAGVTSKQVISDNEFFKLTAPEEAVSKSRSDAVFTDNPDISNNSVEFRNSGTKEVTYEAKATGTLTVYCYFQDHKNIECMDTETGDIQAKLMNDALEKGDQSWLVGTVHFNVEAGKTYQLYGRGGTAQLFGVMYEAEYPQSDTSLAANSGDQIRIVASADSGYVFGSILVNGKQAATTKEYIMTVTENATVSATFEKEPDVVDQTLIASDAALTREAMGAILYDAYLAAYGKNEDGSWNKVPYMNQNGTVPSPDDPNYDPNIDYTGTPYIPLIGWGKLPDTDQIETSLYMKVKEAYNLGLMRVEEGASRGVLTNGDEEHNNNHLEPKVEVTRAKAAKTLVFCYILTQPLKGESQIIPDNTNKAAATVADIIAPNPDAPSTPYTK